MALLALLVAGLATASVLASSTSPQVVATSDRSVTIATLPCATSLQATSTGFVIDDEAVLTVAHAIYESRDFAVRDVWGRWHSGEVRYLDLERDLALVHVDGLRASPVEFGIGRPDDVVEMVAGAASGTQEGLIRRSVNIKTEVVGDLQQESQRRGYELALDITAGDSGAGVVDAEGGLVAIIFARSTKRAATTWATATSEVEAVLDARGVPEWNCGPGSGRELILESRETTELAG